MYDMKKYNDFFEAVYDKYVLLSKDESKILHINRKRAHSYRVVENSLSIAKSLNLDENDMFMLNIISLFHDIGRSKQFYLYSTYVDGNCEDHAHMGVEILKSTNILDDLSVKEKEIIYESIIYHDLKDLPKEIKPKPYLYTSILRDADKIDWLYGMVNIIPNLPANEQKTFYAGISNNGSISKELAERILNKETIKSGSLKNIDELRVAGLAYITSDINYDRSFEIIKEKDILDQAHLLINMTKQAQEVFNFINEYLESKIQKNN